jgi:two-component system CheB/CheR fusion protein
MTKAQDDKFEILLDHLKRNRGFDFRGYKRPTLERRMLKRMQELGVSDYVDYLDILEAHPEEFTQLFDTILINVTSFFRDQPAWDYLAAQLLPRILAARTPGQLLRVWSAGCASGEEVYSLVMLLAEALGVQDFSRQVKIYATDADEAALNLARQGSFTEKDIRAIPASLREKYFKRAGSQYVFRSDLRRAIVFGTHNLIQDAPISHLDLLVCRNTLMYLNAETQERILARFHFALNENGYLFVGKAEMLLTHGNLFTPVAMPFRIFRKNSLANKQDPLLRLVHASNRATVPQPDDRQPLRELAFEAGLDAQVVIDAGWNLRLANEKAMALFKLNPKDLDQPLKDLELSYRPVELRSLLEQVASERHPLKVSNVDRTSLDGEFQNLEVEVTPLKENGNGLAGFSIIYADVTPLKKTQAELQHSNRDLKSIREEIKSAREKLETANEELQSTNEELETTNEELQATNEELETMNEELQATNKELETINDELQVRTEETNSINAFLQSILGGLHSGVMAVDRQLNLLLWNNQAEELWGLRSEDVLGKSIFDLDIGLPTGQLPLQAFLSGAASYQELSLPATNRRGKAFQCHVICTPYLSLAGERRGVVLLMEQVTREA